MIDISVQGIVKAFEVDKNILDGLTFEINAGERVGLLGKNGAGKTTLFRILTGELSSDEGEFYIGGGKRIGLISQIPRYPEQYTVEEVLETAHSRLYGLSREMELLAGEMSDNAGKELMGRYDRAAAQFEALGGYEMDTDRNKVANGLNIPETMRAQLFATLSGGEKTRVNLARLILEETDILLLDEPTNHLDLKSTQWLEEYLLKFPGTVIAISHDRYFLDAVVTRTVEIVGGKAEFYSGNYSFYTEEKARRYEEQLLKYEKEQGEIKRLSVSAERLAGWGIGNRKLMQKAISMRSRIERLERTERPDKERQIGGRLSEKEFRGDRLVTIKSLSKSYGEKTLFGPLDLEAEGGERIALIGDNGTGKSTLIKILMGEETPDTGFVQYGPAVKKAYLPQIIKFDHPHRSILDTMLHETNCTTQTARNRLGAFKFRGEDVFTPVSELSGGEQSRLRLCVLMNEEINFLILDEPTNHLDLTSREWIEEILDGYGEALLFVSHDRYFISRFATRIWELEDGEIKDFKGGYAEFLSCKENLDGAGSKQQRRKEKKPTKKKTVPPEKQLERLEKEIAALEEEKAAAERVVSEFSSDYEKLLELMEEIKRLDESLGELYDSWEELCELTIDN